MSTDESYERSARYYDAAYAAQKSLGPDARFYEQLAVETGGPVLELGCGTGRVLLPIAARGLACTGIDASPAMLAQLCTKPGARGITTAVARMESFDLGSACFRLIYSAFRAFQHLDTVDLQLACLARVRRHLAPGGVFAFDVFNPRLERMAQDEEPETQDLAFTCNGVPMKRLTAVTRDRSTQVMHVTMRYVAEADDPAVPELTVQFSMWWFWRYELEHLLHRTGFGQVEIFGDFDRSPITRTSPAFVVIAR